MNVGGHSSAHHTPTLLQFPCVVIACLFQVTVTSHPHPVSSAAGTALCSPCPSSKQMPFRHVREGCPEPTPLHVPAIKLF